MAPARAALRLRPAPLSAQSPPTYWPHDVIASQTFLPKIKLKIKKKKHKITDFSPLLLIPDLAAIIFTIKTGYTAGTRGECGRSGKHINSGAGGVCIHLCIRANVPGTGPGGRDRIGPTFTSVLPSSLLQTTGETRSPAAAAILEPGLRACAGGCG